MAGYFCGKNAGFQQGFKLGTVLAKCRISLKNEDDDDDSES